VNYLRLLPLLCLPLLVPPSIEAKTIRSAAEVARFKAANPCPSNQQPKGPCPGFIVDHIVPLCAHGADKALNMQWQMISEAKLKDKEEVSLCRTLKRSPTARVY